MIFNMTKPVLETLPRFTYTGTYELIDDGGGNWRIKFLTSGILTPLKDMFVDEFLVAGGGAGGYTSGSFTTNAHCSGGGSGYTKTVKGATLKTGKQYIIVIGEGGTKGNAGGNTEAFGETVSGGNPGSFSSTLSNTPGGDGASGGGGAKRSETTKAGNGGSDGSDGEASGSTLGGVGQGSTTREFGEDSGDLYAGGGGGWNGAPSKGTGGAGGGGDSNKDGTANTGGGGGAFKSGGSGIVIIRKHKEAAA